MSRKNKIALGLLVIGLATMWFYDQITGALVVIIAGMYAE